MKTPLIALALVLAATPALAQRQYAQDNSIGGAVTQPLRDLGVVRRDAPQQLQDTAKDPYQKIDTENCPAMFAEIAQLDGLLGPDLNDPASQTKGNLAADAVRSVVRLPFASVVRRVTGAEKRERARQRAIAAGMTRRAYLKGAITQCDKAAPPPMLVREQAPAGESADAAANVPDLSQEPSPAPQ